MSAVTSAGPGVTPWPAPEPGAAPFVTLDRAFVAAVAKTRYAQDVVHLADSRRVVHDQLVLPLRA